MPLDRVEKWDGDLTRCHSPTACCWLSTFSSARVAHHNRSTNPPTRRTFKPLLIFSTLTLETFSNLSQPLPLLTAHPLLNLPQGLTQWCLPCSVRRRPVAVTESHAAPAATSLFYLPTPTQPNLPPARLCASSTLQANTKHKVGNPKYSTQYLLY